ncbi:MAG TPA: plastocyanin/azurin family copper-binding protein [Gemmatimonadaceae bacterium]|nr:plastocyanin/azurin family copper-binding protein [Gemmatimonadaceae bacterium]
MRKFCSTMFVAGFFVVVSGCGSGGYGSNNSPTGPGTGTTTCPAGAVCMGPATFVPANITVPSNTTVTFSNTSTVDHEIVFDAPLPATTANIGLVSYGSSATRTFATVGTYNFHCTIHPSTMVGKVVVQ